LEALSVFLFQTVACKYEKSLNTTERQIELMKAKHGGRLGD
jgi:hypothetical protein